MRGELRLPSESINREHTRVSRAAWRRKICLACRAGASGPVGPVLAGPISVRKRGRVKLCTNAIVSVSMRKRRRTHTRVKLNVRAGSRSRRGQIWPDQRKCASAGPGLTVSVTISSEFQDRASQ